MKSILKVVKQLETTYEVLEYIENVISKIKDSEFTKNILDIDNNFVSWQRIEIIANKIAIKKAKSPEEFEACATHIEKNDYGDFIFDSDEWAEQVRIKAYGIDWYFNKYINSPEFENFLYFLDKEFNSKQITK